MKTFLFTLVIMSSLSAIAQSNAYSILNETSEAVNSHRSIAYTAKKTFKGCDRPDTMFSYGDVSLLRVQSDSEFGGMIYLAPYDNTYTFYDLDKVYSIDKYNATAKVLDNPELIRQVKKGKKYVQVKEIAPHKTLGSNFMRTS